MRRCPDLYWDAGAGRYLCRLILDPGRNQGVLLNLGVGEGCCAPLNDWRNDVRNRDKD